MANFDITAAQFALKELYDDQKVAKLVYQDEPFLALVPKKTNFGGKYRPIPVITGNSHGRSATFATAQANQTAVEGDSFLLTRKKDYSIATLDNETMEAMASDKMAFLEGAEVVVDGAFGAARRSLAGALFRSGTGSIGKISAISSGVITLVNALDVVHFEVGQALQANATDGGGSPRATGYVIAVDRDAGTVTVSASVGGSAGDPASWAANDFLLMAGDNNAKVSGLEAWVPATAPTSTLFYGVDRSSDPVRLGGIRYDGSAMSIEEALIGAASRAAREGAHPTHCFTNFTSFAALEMALGSKVQYCDLSGPAGIGFRGIRINGPTGEIKVIADRNCQASVAWMLQLDTWCLHSLGEAPKFLKYTDNNQMLRVYNADAAELRVGYYANLGCSAPGYNVRVALGA